MELSKDINLKENMIDAKENKESFFKNLFKKKNKNELIVRDENTILLFEQIKIAQEEYQLKTLNMMKENTERIEKLEEVLLNAGKLKENIIDVNVKLTIEPALETDKIINKSHKLYQSREDMLNEICKWYPEFNKQDILGQVILEAYNKYKPLDIIDNE